MPARMILLVTTPRLPVGLLTAEAWDLVRRHPVLIGAGSDWTDVLAAAGASVRPAAARAEELIAAATELAVRSVVVHRPGLTVGLAPLLGLA